MGKTGGDAEGYAKEVVIADLQEAGDEDVIDKVMADIEAAKLDIDRPQIEAKLAEFMVEAGTQLGLMDDE